MKKAYVYPITAFAEKTIPNPYLENVMRSLEGGLVFVNKDHPSDRGIFDLWKYRKEVDFVFLNWIEDLPDKKGGLIQAVFFVIMVFIMQRQDRKIFWTMHNKLSHYKTNYRIKKWLFRFLIRKSDFILTHSTEGLEYINRYHSGENQQKIKYLPHPLENKFIAFEQNPSYDILIWGSIIPYKGIDTFLQILHEKGLDHKYRILIAGKVKPDEYEEIIDQYCNENIHLENRYVPEEELKKLIADTRIVLFTYSGNSVLSSGVLMDTLSYGAKIIAPDVAAFKDAGKYGIISTFREFEDLIKCIEKELEKDTQVDKRLLEQFIRENNWERFSENILNWIQK